MVAVDLVNSLLLYRRMLLQEALTAAQDLQSQVDRGEGASINPAVEEGAQDD